MRAQMKGPALERGAWSAVLLADSGKITSCSQFGNAYEEDGAPCPCCKRAYAHVQSSLRACLDVRVKRLLRDHDNPATVKGAAACVAIIEFAAKLLDGETRALDSARLLANALIEETAKREFMREVGLQ